MKRIPDVPPPSIYGAVGEYANAVGKYGPDSKQTRAVREKYAVLNEQYGGLDDFVDYADGLDRVKRRLGGKGMKS